MAYPVIVQHRMEHVEQKSVAPQHHDDIGLVLAHPGVGLAQRFGTGLGLNRV